MLGFLQREAKIRENVPARAGEFQFHEEPAFPTVLTDPGVL
jgi:hypothetical protein